MSDTEKKLAFLLATSPHLDTVSGSYDEAAMDLVANGVVPVVRCLDCKHWLKDVPDAQTLWDAVNSQITWWAQQVIACTEIGGKTNVD